jgi:predicted membrane chloride channel (bestrophin family)
MLRLALSVLSIVASTTDAFAPGNLNVPKVKDTSRAMSAPPLPPPIDVKDISYGEDSRQYRRTVYTHDDWVKHRDSSRFYRNILSITNSGVYKNLGKEVFATCSIATGIVVWNCLFGTYQDLAGVVHDGPFKESIIPILSLPLTPFTLSSPSLGLLLVFRTNTSYQRWDEARKNWGMNINHTRDLVRMGNSYYDRSMVPPERAEEDLRRLALCTWAFVRSMKRHLSPEWEDEEPFRKELYEKLPELQAQKIIEATHRPNRALQDLSVAIENLPMHFMRKNEIHQAATIFEDNLGSSERLLTSPVPLFYSRHTARFISFWLLLVPFALWEPLKGSWNHINLIPATLFLSVFLFGIEELATQLEEPFTILPMQGFCDKIYNWCTEIVSFKPGDNGLPLRKYDNATPGPGVKVN